MLSICEQIAIFIYYAEEMCEDRVLKIEHEPIFVDAFQSELEYLGERLRPFGLLADISMPKPPYEIDPRNQQIIVRGKAVEA